jgi:glutaredoxin-like protein NrdH
MLKMTVIQGDNKGNIVLYALSTCGWCAKTKRYLDKLGVRYAYVDVDMLDDADSEDARAAMHRWNPQISFPLIVINDEISIVGYKPEKILEAIA